MNRSLAIGAVALLLLVTGCVNTRTGAHYDQTHDFSEIRRFSWLSDEPAVIPPDADPGNSPLLHKYIKQGIEEVLLERGFKRATSREDADFLVGYLIGSRDRIAGSQHTELYGGRPWSGNQPGSFVNVEVAEHQVFRESTLSIDVFDAVTGEPIWHGWATKTITEADRAAPQAPVRAAIASILRPFPPG